MIDKTALETLLAAGKAAAPKVVHDPAPSSILAPVGYQLIPVPPAALAPLPDHIRASVTLCDPESFSLYVKRYSNARTLLFANLPNSITSEDASVAAIFDYHRAEKDGETADGQPQRCAHSALYPMPYSYQWKQWTEQHHKALSQRDFIDFIDENMPEITAPPSAELMEVAEKFEARTEVTFQSKVDRVTSGRQLTFKEDVTAGAGGTIRVPDALALSLPVFEGGKPYPLRARLEWKPRDGKLSISIVLHRAELVLREAFDDIRADLAASTGHLILTGHPGR